MCKPKKFTLPRCVGFVGAGRLWASRPPLPSTNLVLTQANRAAHTPHTRQIGPATQPGEFFKVFACLVMFCAFAFFSSRFLQVMHPLAQSTSARHGEHMIAWASTGSSLHLSPSPSSSSLETGPKIRKIHPPGLPTSAKGRQPYVYIYINMHINMYLGPWAHGPGPGP